MPQDAGTMPTPAPQQGVQDPNKMQIMMKLLQSLSPAMGQALQPQAQPQSTQSRPATPPPAIPPAPPPAQMQTKFDPMSNVGTLPQPVAQPGRPGYTPPTGTAELLSKLDPKGAAVYQGVQGVTKYITDAMQRRDQKQQAEAQNAAQALMSALEGAKTTGDYSPAQHIFENNEALFNKVYKGWIQKEEEAKKESQKPKKEAKKPDPEVTGFEKGLADYLGKGAAKQPGQPQPPSTLQGKSGAKYYMPQAGPQQAVAQQNTSTQMQAQRQDPSRDLPENAALRDPKVQAELGKSAVEYAKMDLEYKKSATELQKAKYTLDAEVQKAGYAEKESQTKLQQSQTELVTAGVRRDTARMLGQIAIQKAKNGGQVPQSFKTRWDAVSKVEALLTKAVTEKRGLTSAERAGLPALLGQAGLATLAKDVPSALGQWTGWNTPSDLLEKIKPYKDTMEDRLSERPSWMGADTTADTGDDSAITISPEDMK
jgi:hypothetical protein